MEDTELDRPLGLALEREVRRLSPCAELVLIRGLPGSGKTTMAKVLELVGYEHHEADNYFMREDVYLFHAGLLQQAHACCVDRMKESLRRGARCVVSNTFTRRWEIDEYVHAAELCGATVRVIEAQGKWVNVHGVLDDAIERMRARWEHFETPNVRANLETAE